MADKTETTRTMSREEFADYLRMLADGFDGDGEMAVSVENKSVTLHPPNEVTTDVEVVERSSILRGDRESIGIDAHWKSTE
ncbi:amphi-Trp domain-containing protein [Halegenticoccus tardaugens]|uniref:amphi-Trp domain-containing protein n=1 Tax=Halegenticoccus tardaugens TaxID=2071624 RepID=UPI00100AF11C|nr:amphi-Trp domain-containing protein [Halegenticoccus tardaugens]